MKSLSQILSVSWGLYSRGSYIRHVLAEKCKQSYEISAKLFLARIVSVSITIWHELKIACPERNIFCKSDF